MATAWGVPRRRSPDMDAVSRMVASLPAPGNVPAPLPQGAVREGPRVTDTQAQGYVPLSQSSNPMHRIAAAQGQDDLSFMDAEPVASPQSVVMLPPLAAAVQAKPKFFGEGGTGRHLLGILGDALAGATGGPARYAQGMQMRRMEEREEARELRKQNQPQFQNVPGVGVVAINPADMSSKVIAAAKSPAQVYAESQGYRPGTGEYNSALADYVLKGSGATAFGYKAELQDDRQESALEALRENIELRRELGRLSAQTSTNNNIRSTGTSAANNIRSTGTSAANNQRSTSTSAANNQRSTATSAANNVRSTSQSNTNNLRSTTTTQGSASYQGRGGKGAGSAARIVNPKTGQAMVLRNGQWVPE